MVAPNEQQSGGEQRARPVSDNTIKRTRNAGQDTAAGNVDGEGSPSLRKYRGSLFERIKELAKTNAIVRPLRTLEADRVRALHGSESEEERGEKHSQEETAAQHAPTEDVEEHPPADYTYSSPFAEDETKEDTEQRAPEHDEYTSQLLQRTPVPEEGEESPPPAPSSSPLRTLKHDAAQTIREGNVSRVSMAAQERTRREARGEPIAASGKRSPAKRAMVVAASIVLVLGGIGSAGYVYYIVTKDTTVGVPQRRVSLMAANSTAEVAVASAQGGGARSALIEELRAASPAEGNVHEITFVAQRGEAMRRLSAEEFVAAVDLPMPSRLHRSLGEQFMVGVHGRSTDGVFLIITTNFFENSFAGMLDWEESIARDLAFLFNAGGAASATDASFRDTVIENIDTRVLRGEDGNTVLLYAFLTPRMLVMTDNPETLVEIRKRLTTSRRITR